MNRMHFLKIIFNCPTPFDSLKKLTHLILFTATTNCFCGIL